MTISDHSETFFGKTIVAYDGGQVSGDPGVVHRLALDYDAGRSIVELLDEFLGKADKAALQALVIGAWSEPHEAGVQDLLDRLAALAPQLPSLKALFIGDITFEECEMSWIVQGDYGALLKAYPRLEALRVRGGTSLEIPAFSHAALRHLVIETGGLPSSVLSALASSSLPALEHLELWVGTDEYGFDGDLDDVRAAVDALRTPHLRYLGLRDAAIADAIAQWLAGESWITQFATLDLSLGTLGDVGAQALLDSPHAAALSRVDLSHHYVSQALQDKLRAAIPGVVLDDAQDDDDGYRFVAVGE